MAFSRAPDCSKLRAHIIFWVALTPFSWHSGLLWVTLCGLLCKACFSLLPQLAHPLQPRLSPILVPLAVAVARHTAGHFGFLCSVLAYLWWCALGLRGLWSGWLPGLFWCLLLPLLRQIAAPLVSTYSGSSPIVFRASKTLSTYCLASSRACCVCNSGGRVFLALVLLYCFSCNFCWFCYW